MALRNPPSWLQAGSHTARNDRLILQSLVQSSGVANRYDFYVEATATSSMGVSVRAGGAFILGTQESGQGVYHCYNDASVTLSVTPASSQNDRKDIVVLRVYDSEISGATNTSTLEVITGSATSSPAEPPVPVNAIKLAVIDVLANASSISGQRISNVAPKAVATSGIIEARSNALPDPLLVRPAQLVWETDTARLIYSNGSAWRYVGHRTVCSTTTRPPASRVYDGLEIYEQDTGRTYIWNAGRNAWVLYSTLPDADWKTPTLLNGWVNYDNDYFPARYRKTSDGVVHVQGLVRAGTGSLSSIFVLPVGYRPNRRLLIATATDPDGALGRIDVLSTGEFIAFKYSPGWFSMASSFFADQ